MLHIWLVFYLVWHLFEKTCMYRLSSTNVNKFIEKQQYWKYDKAASILYVATSTILDISIPAGETLTQYLLNVGPPSTTSALD